MKIAISLALVITLGAPACVQPGTLEASGAEATPVGCGPDACATGDSTACATTSDWPQDLPEGPLARHELESVLDWIRDAARRTPGPVSIGPDDIEGATGLVMTEPAMDQVERAVEIAFFMSDGSSSRCADYGACSLYGDLSTATGATLARYEAEKSQDGQPVGRPLPAFDAVTLAGAPVSSDSLRGKPALIVPLAVHCSHSFQTIPLLRDLAEELEPTALEVVGVWVNAPSAEDVRQTLAGERVGARVQHWVSSGDALGATLDFQLVPSLLLVDADGVLVRKFVGYQDASALRAAVDEILVATPAAS